MNPFNRYSRMRTCGTAVLLSVLATGCAGFQLCGDAPAPDAAAIEPSSPAPVPAKVTFSANTLFDFDEAGLKPEGRQALDAFVADLGDADFFLITVTGHTDRLGSNAYNRDLSKQRADAVKTYLVETAEITSDKITARGLGESDPVTPLAECRGVIATAELIACLQPDRRVEIEVTGTK